MALDLIVLGGGSAGVRLARTAASLGASVVLIEGRELGGTCVNRGCVPKKLLSLAAAYPDKVSDMASFGWSTDGIRCDWPALVRSVQAELSRLVSIYGRLIDNSGAKLVRGHGRIVGERTVEVDGQRLSADHVAVCVGGRPKKLPFPGGELALVSDDLFTLPELPSRVAVFGAGYIGAEFASIFAGFGCEVHWFYRDVLPLRGFDADVRTHVAGSLQRRGVVLHPGCTDVTLEAVGPQRRVRSSGGEWLVDLAVSAVGREPRTADLGLDTVGLALGEGGYIPVDDRLRTSLPWLSALGDVIGRLQLTPMALAEATWLARVLYAPHLAGTLSYDAVPTAVFCKPPVAVVGLTEEQAAAVGPIRVYLSTFRPLELTLGSSTEKMLMKLVVDAQTDRVLGVHVVGPDAPEIVQGFAVAVKMGATKANLDATIGIHPTAAEELVTMRTPTPRP